MNALSPSLRRASAAMTDTLREHPLGTALPGMGLVWLIGSRTGVSGTVGRAPHSAGDAVSSGAIPVRRSASRASNAAADLVNTTADAVGDIVGAPTSASRGVSEVMFDAARRAREDAADMFDDAVERIGDFGRDAAATTQARAAREWLSHALENEPLLLAAGGLAIGAAIAATLPSPDAGARNDALSNAVERV